MNLLGIQIVELTWIVILLIFIFDRIDKTWNLPKVSKIK